MNFDALQDEVIRAAKELIHSSGPYRASDGYISVKIGDDRRLRKAVETLEVAEAEANAETLILFLQALGGAE